MDNQNLNYQNVNNGEQNSYSAQYSQDPLLSQPVMPQKKKISKGETIVSVIISVVVWRLFGLIGAAICYGGYAAVRAITRSTKLQTGAKIALGVLVGLAFVVLLVVYIVVVAVVYANM